LIAVIGFFMFNSPSAPAAFSITSGDTYQIKNNSTSQYLLPLLLNRLRQCCCS
jgi:hypothetical protein